MRRSSVIKLVLSGIGLTALLLAIPAVYDNRERKLDVYRAFVSAYSEGHRVNLANVTTRFDAETDGAIACAPTILATTLVSRVFRTTTLDQSDFQSPSVHIVNPEDQAAQVRIHDPSMNISNESDIDRAVANAFNAGLLQVSEVGFDITGQHAMLTFPSLVEDCADTEAQHCLTAWAIAGFGRSAVADRSGCPDRVAALGQPGSVSHDLTSGGKSGASRHLPAGLSRRAAECTTSTP